MIVLSEAVELPNGEFILHGERQKVTISMTEQDLVRRIRCRARQLASCSVQEIRRQSLALKFSAQTGSHVRNLLVDAFGLVVEASRRTVGQVHYDVQILCGIRMSKGHIAEMKTGEGKTLTAGLVTYLFALFGRGVHVVTFNEYLAQRDAEFLRPMFNFLGMNVRVLTENMQENERSAAYLADITYGATKEFGFDFLRDRLAIAATQNDSAGVMRGTHYAVIDEADSILIDEARTPLIIGMVNPGEENLVQGCCRWAASNAHLFQEGYDFRYDQVRQNVKLLNKGYQKVRSIPQSVETARVSIKQLYQFVENAIKVFRDFHLDKTYSVVDEEIVILDEFTGRPAEGRQWQKGIHQAVQAKEGLEITPATSSAASITLQSFFGLYENFSGMTGTAWTSRREFRKIYKKKVVRIPTHRPVNRIAHSSTVFQNQVEKFQFIAGAVAQLRESGRAILIGTRSVRASESMSECLRDKSVPHRILNARYLEQEAKIVENAGQPGAVTVATNMAGRGTDIKLKQSVKENGGLHVFLTELHFSQRVDWQLIGRCSRQADPGSYQICVSLEDEILRAAFGAKVAKQLVAKFAAYKVRSSAIFRLFRKAQRRMEQRHFVDRLIVQKQDEERKKASFDTGQDPYLTTIIG